MEEMTNIENGEMAARNGLLAKVLNRLNSILDKHMYKHPKYKELIEFMKDENNLYNEDGSLKEEYEEWIKDVEEFSIANPIRNTLEEMHKDDPLWQNIFEGIEAYVSANAELTKTYEEAQKEEGENFDPEEWIYTQLKQTSKDEKEADEKMSTLVEMISKETLNLLDESSELRKMLKEKVDNNGTK